MTSAAASMSRSEAAALLGVPVDATAAEVQRAFLRAARRTHPDVLTEADEAARRAAGAAFDRLTRARDVLLQPVDPLIRAEGPAPGAGGPALHRPPQRGLANALVVLALLGFLLIGIVSAERALLGWVPGGPPAMTTAP